MEVIALGSGTAAYRGDPAVVRLPVTQADRDFFATYNASRTPGNQRAVVGGIDFLRASFFNRAEQFVNGYDFDATYRLPRTPLGNFSVSTKWSYINDFHAYNRAGAPRTELLETNAAFYAAQMTAMDSASRNSADMIENLTLYMNKVRQAAITREIIEVVSGASAT